MDINTDPNYGRIWGLLMVPDSSPGRMSPWSQMAAQAIQTGMSPVAAWPLDTNTAPGGSTIFNGLRKPQTSTQILEVAGLWTQT